MLNRGEEKKIVGNFAPSPSTPWHGPLSDGIGSDKANHIGEEGVPFILRPLELKLYT
jgi:hypothetical protein